MTEMQCDVCGQRWWDEGQVFCPSCAGEEINPVYEEEAEDEEGLRGAVLG